MDGGACIVASPGMVCAVLGAGAGITWTMPHCGHLACLPTAVAGTFNIRAQPEQGNSTPAAVEPLVPKGVVLMDYWVINWRRKRFKGS
jgi:hypothetical protein